MSSRPIREIVNSQVFWPSAKGAVPRERRSNNRFRCKLPATLVCGDKELPVECVEISDTGVRISSHWPIRLTVQQAVSLKVRVGTQRFADDFLVVRISRTGGALSIHLRLAADEPAANRR
jgi:hypothetical protein